MRDRQAYVAAGRSDPGSPDQKREHPYDFVSLPERPAAGEAVGHDRYACGRWSGRLTLVYETLTPLHVGSGVFETAADCGLAGGAEPLRGIARRLGRPILPGSGWKGAVRSRFEAITRSRLAVCIPVAREGVDRIPGPLRDGSRRYRVEMTDPRVTGSLRSLSIPADVQHPEKARSLLARLSPAEAVFGALGYRGRVAAGDGVVTGPEAEAPILAPPLESPHLHRLARPGRSLPAGRGRIVLSEVEGRKFYYDGPVLTGRRVQRGGRPVEISETLDAVPAGSRIEIEVRVASLTRAELGALLVAAGWGPGAGVLRFGGGKPAGLGKVRLAEVSGSLAEGSAVGSFRRPPGRPLDPEAAVAEARRELLDPDALAELAAVTTERRP